jgi:hypothetical protein
MPGLFKIALFLPFILSFIKLADNENNTYSRVGRYTLNEAELRQLMLEVCRGEKQPGIKVVQKNVPLAGGYTTATAIIEKDGSLSANLPGLALTTDISMTMFREQRKNK